MKANLSPALLITIGVLITGSIVAAIFILPKSSTQQTNTTTISEINNQVPAGEQKTENAQSQSTASVNQAAQNTVDVPLPSESDIIRTFFQLIADHRPTDAVGMMDPDVVGDDSMKQAWAVQFNAFELVVVNSVEPWMPGAWQADRHTYQVIVTAKMKPEAVNAPLPYYGWENGSNIRWITIVKNGDLWKIAGIATGP